MNKQFEIEHHCSNLREAPISSTRPGRQTIEYTCPDCGERFDLRCRFWANADGEIEGYVVDAVVVDWWPSAPR